MWKSKEFAKILSKVFFSWTFLQLQWLNNKIQATENVFYLKEFFSLYFQFSFLFLFLHYLFICLFIPLFHLFLSCFNRPMLSINQSYPIFRIVSLPIYLSIYLFQSDFCLSVCMHLCFSYLISISLFLFYHLFFLGLGAVEYTDYTSAEG